MARVYFLSASKPLTKSFTLNAENEIEKHAYPSVLNFTSFEETYHTLAELYAHLVNHASKNHCMLKGKLQRELINESRAGATLSNDKTKFACIDLDRTMFRTPEEFMQSYSELKDLAYIVQYSASSGIYKNDKTLSCHIFILLNKEIEAPILKTWLQNLNLRNKTARESMSLSRTGATLHYSVDITTCQNDKLIYIAPPHIQKGIHCALKDEERIQYIPKIEQTLNVDMITSINPESVKKECRKLLEDFRDKAGYEKLKVTTRWNGEYEIISKPGTMRITGIKSDENFMRFNFNGGDSWAYYHPHTNFELIHDFKNPDQKYITKEILPDYYRDCVAQRAAENASPIEGGEILLAFRDFKSSTYWNGTWNPVTYKMDIAKARDSSMLRDFLASYGREMGEFVPIWRMAFEPNQDYVVDDENNRINIYVPTEYMRRTYSAAELAAKPTVNDLRTACPLIYKIILSAVSDNEENEILEHFLNWLAVIYQKRIKTITSWVLTGTYGTGKSALIEHIIQPTLGPKYVAMRKAGELEEDYNGWMEHTLIGFIDEIQVAASAKSGKIMSNLKNHITGASITLRNMHSMAYEAQSFINFIFASNKPDPVVTDEEDRRFNFGLFQSVKLSLTREDIYTHLPRELDGFVKYMMTREININAASTILDNQTRQNVIDASRSSLDELGMFLKKGMLEKLWDAMPDLNLIAEIHNTDSALASAFADIIKREINFVANNKTVVKSTGKAVAESKLTRDEMHVVFQHCVGNMPNTPNKFTSLLRHRGIHIEPIRVGEHMMRGIPVEWKIPDERLMEIYKQINVEPKLKAVPHAEPKKQKG
jgi:hypothetical protein